MDKFSNIRKKVQLISVVASSIILAVALHGIITHNEHYFEIGLLLIGAMLAGGLLLAPVLGRFWCGWLCPRGTFLEYVLGKVSNRSSIPKKMRTTEFKLLIASIMAVMFLMVLLGKNPLLASQDKLASVGGFIVFLCVVTTALISIPLGIIYMPRTWCSFCPVGYAQSLLSKNKILHVSIEDCRNCKKCHGSCHLDICRDYTGKSKIIEDPDCFACMKCTDACKLGANKPVISLHSMH
ncbi:MAG: 4Fe-4S binding protein [Candidatus Methanoperedens sp.]|nr:4Fe-4S binding protein [Candidatus Methanoperedens sp.]